jgi:cytochrome c biogenesis protein CcdA
MFGIDLWDASLLPALLVAGAGGVLSFLSPCVLPIVPAYIAYMAGSSMDTISEGEDAGRGLRAAIFFVLGLSTVFLMLGLAASALGRVLLAHQREMAMVAGAVIALFGLHFSVCRMGDSSASVSCGGVQRLWSHPIGMYTNPSRGTGLAGVWAHAVAAGIIASSRGNARAACAPFRNVRRGSAFFVMIMMMPSFETERFSRCRG